MSLMAVITSKKKTVAEAAALKIVLNYLDRDVTANTMVWVLLGGAAFMPKAPGSVMDLIEASYKGIPKSSIVNLATVLDIPMKDMSRLLNVSYKTIGRKKNSDALNTLSSSLSVEIANTTAKGLSVFEDPRKFNTWLH